ncbi:MAG: hypothetical protein KIT22_19075 [Verrucomicrobiae bacterium]|nr:hypothetical protein [Verrucomicrobiae bacterium]
MKRCFRLTAAVLVCLSLGLHWAALQSVAWTTMVIERTCSTSLSDALATTFDGRHPCTLCKVVKAGQAADDSSGILFQSLKLEAFPPIQVVWLNEPPGSKHYGGAVSHPPADRSQPPLLPPPRIA